MFNRTDRTRRWLARRLWPRRMLLLAALVALAAPHAAAQEEKVQAPAAALRADDEIWLASTRHLPCAASGQQPALWRLSGGQWQEQTPRDFHAGNGADAATVIYIHGNRIDDAEGVSGGLAVYQHVVAAHAGPQRVRFLIWSWPSTKICGPIRDVRAKAWRSDDEALLLAQFLAQNETAEWRVGIIAFSYGARITGGALHLLAGGPLDGASVAAASPPRFRVAFWAAAAHCDWLCPHPSQRHGLALPLGDQWLNLVNPRDESLVRYEALELKGGNPPALGFVGLCGREQLPADLAARWEEWDVSTIVGRTHNYHPYVYNPWPAERTAQVVLGLQP